MAIERADIILQTAARLFADKGYKGVSVDEIAEVAGVSKGLIFHHFCRKQHLLRQILRTVTVPLGEKLDAVSKSDGTVRAKLEEVVDVFIGAASSFPDAMRIIMLEGYSGEETKGLLLAIREANQARFARLIKEGIAKGEMSPIDPQVGALIIGGILREVLWETVVQKLPSESDRIADAVVTLIYDGMGRRK